MLNISYTFFFVKLYSIFATLNTKKRAVSKIKKYCKNYIYELFRISQCKTGNEFRKSQQPDFLGVF